MNMTKHRFTVIILISLIVCFYGCSRRRVPNQDANNRHDSEYRDLRKKHNNNRKTIVRMRLHNGVYYVPCRINDVDMEFIFDTGASDITISMAEAYFMYKQGKLQAEDIIGEAQYRIADGSISVGTIINLKSVTIGNKTLHDVKASVVSNIDAPLLLGQSALSRFGKISIDYKRNEIFFE